MASENPENPIFHSGCGAMPHPYRTPLACAPEFQVDRDILPVQERTVEGVVAELRAMRFDIIEGDRAFERARTALAVANRDLACIRLQQLRLLKQEESLTKELLALLEAGR